MPVLFVWSRSDSPRFPTSYELHQAFLAWDSQHYVDIALHGYPRQLDFLDAFLPGYPLLLRALVLVLRDPVVAGLLLSAAGELVALIYLAKLVLHERDLDDARFAVWTLAFWPLAFFLTAIYTESVFIACAAASLYYSRAGDTISAAIAGFLASAVRITGVVLVVPLLVEHLRRRRGRPGPEIIAVLLVPFPLVFYALYMQLHTGDAFAYLDAQSLPQFGHHADWPWQGFRVSGGVLLSNSQASLTWVFALEVWFGVIGAATCVATWLWPRFPRSLAAYCSGVWLISTSISFWRSVPRYEMAMFPALIMLADATKHRPSWRSGLVAGSAGLMSLGAVIFSKGWWLG